MPRIFYDILIILDCTIEFEICLRFYDFKTLTQFEMHLGDIIYTCSRPNVQHIILFVYADLVSLKCIAVIYANSVFGRPQMQFS